MSPGHPEDSGEYQDYQHIWIFVVLIRQGCGRFVLSDRERGPDEPSAEVDAA